MVLLSTVPGSEEQAIAVLVVTPPLPLLHEDVPTAPSLYGSALGPPPLFLRLFLSGPVSVCLWGFGCLCVSAQDSVVVFVGVVVGDVPSFGEVSVGRTLGGSQRPSFRPLRLVEIKCLTL